MACRCLSWLCFIWILRCVINTSCDACKFGSGSDCIFPCRCKDQAECNDDVECPGGCEEGLPRPAGDPGKFDWRGPACQIGNIGQGKPAAQTGAFSSLVAAFGVDGKLEVSTVNRFCAHPDAPDNTNAWWRVDLEDQHVVYNITVFNTRDGYGYERMEQFVIGVGDSEDVISHTQCAQYGSPAVARGGDVTLNCNRPLTGRYVSFRRNGQGFEPRLVTLCEVVVMGYRVVEADCRNCVSGAQCDDVLGCSQCVAGYKPVFCNEACDRGTYGVDCSESCSTHHCSGGYDQCSPTDGSCPGGCDDWYLGGRCDQLIANYSLGDDNDVTAVAESSERVLVSWESQPDITSSLAQYYFYTVECSENGTSDEYQSCSDDVDHVDGQSHHSAVISGLRPSTVYKFRVILYRQQNTRRERLSATTSVVTISTPEATNGGGGTDSGGVSAGVVGGAAAGGVVVIVLVVVLIVVILRRRKKSKRTTASNVAFSKRLSGSHTEHDGSLVNQTMNSDVEDQPSTPLTAPPQMPSLKKEPQSPKREKPETTSKPVAPQKPILSTSKTSSDTYLEPARAAAVDPPNKPLKLHQISDHYNRLSSLVTQSSKKRKSVKKQENVDGFDLEFEKLPGEHFAPHDIGQLPVNAKKNRFANIHPFDDNRILLDKDQGSGYSDYINASYIKGYKDIEKYYIASQGPRPNTLPEFLHMIWQQKCNRIVMLTKLTEKGKTKCEQYWPDNTGTSNAMNIGPFQVTLVFAEEYCDYAYRKISLTYEGRTHEVHQLHFLAWPDKGCPDNAFPLIAFRRRAHQLDRLGKGPLIVHCSAGVGRTGTYIALDYLTKQAETEGQVDVFACVHRLRTQRMFMVQTKAQYKFVYSVLLEAGDTFFGNTAIPCSSFSDDYAAKCRDGEYSNTNGLAAEFELLNKYRVESTTSDTCAALDPENANKNRDPTVLPHDKRRVFVSTPHQGSNDYINAVNADSFKKPQSTILTHLPLPDTIVDFWRLIYDHKCDTIVMLNDIDSSEPEQYWPDDGSEKTTYGPIKVEPQKAEIKSTSVVIVREFLVSKVKTTMEEEALRVCQLHLTSWPHTHQVPPNVAHLLELIEQCILWQQLAKDGPLVLMCRNGAERCGLFAAGSYVIDKIKVDQEVDAFLAARYVTTRRPEAINTLEQYRFLFELAECYMHNFDTYANFK